jgi:multidrug efflux pump
MTNLAIIIALVPQALGRGPGSFYRVPMAVVTMGGIAASSIFTLFLIPVLYLKVERVGTAVRKRVERIEGMSGEYTVPAR